MLQCLEYKCVVALPLACHGSSKYLIRLLEELWRTCGSASRGLLYTWSQCFHLIGLFYSELPDMIWPLLWSAVAWKSLTLRLCSTGSRSSGKTIFVHITAGLGWRLTVEMISAHKKTYLTFVSAPMASFYLFEFLSTSCLPYLNAFAIHINMYGLIMKLFHTLLLQLLPLMITPRVRVDNCSLCG